jgi:hypothetical protein
LRFRGTLLPAVRIGIPDGIEQHEHNPYVVLVGDLQKFIHPVQKTLRILFPQQIVQKYPHRIHAQRLRPTQFPVNHWQIECLGLPHFEFVNGCACHKVAAHQPRLP